VQVDYVEDKSTNMLDFEDQWQSLLKSYGTKGEEETDFRSKPHGNISLVLS
jgi:hypothetical protein